MLRKYYGLLLILICVSACVLLVFKDQLLFVSLGAEEPQSVKSAQSKMIVEQKIRGVYLVDTQQNNTNWELWAESALSSSETSDWRFNEITVKFYTEDKSVYIVKSGIASVNVKKKEMFFEGGVVVTSPNGYQMTTESIHYDFDEKIIISNKDVEVVSTEKLAKDSLYYSSSDLAVDLKTSTIFINDIFSRRVVNQKKMTIKSKEALLYGNSYKVRYKKNVRFKGYGFLMQAYVVDFKINQRQKTVKDITARGQVNIKSDQRTIRAGHAHLNVRDEVITLTDNPQVVQNSDILLGEKVIFYSKTKSISVKKPRAKVDRQGLEKYNEPITGQ